MKRWWVLLDAAPADLLLNVEHETHSVNNDYSFLPDFPLEVYRPDILVDTIITVGVGNGSWIVDSYVLKADTEADALRLHAVYAKRPPGFGWWMPTLKDEGL